MKPLREQLIEDEGLKLKPYHCTAGYLTIGVGRNLDTNGISKDEALQMLDNDIARCTAELRQTFTWFESLDSVRQEVLINMCFNMGLKTLKTFVNTLRLISEGRYKSASESMLKSKWAEQVGARAERLAEAMKEGK